MIVDFDHWNTECEDVQHIEYRRSGDIVLRTSSEKIYVSDNEYASMGVRPE